VYLDAPFDSTCGVMLMVRIRPLDHPYSRGGIDCAPLLEKWHCFIGEELACEMNGGNRISYCKRRN
jgi:hypothetical protein